MAPTYVPLTPSVLRWAMEQSGAEPADLAQRTRAELDVVIGWLSGDAQPTKTQFAALASMFKRPAAFFMLPRPPKETGIPAAFRHPAGQTRQEATKDELDAIARAQRVQRIAHWTAEGVSDERWAKRPAPHVAASDAPAHAATLAAKWLGWNIAEQKAANNATAVVKIIRSRLEERGVLALQLSIGEQGCRGFSLSDKLKPLIAVNTAYNPEARLFTYMHEVGHLMRRSDAICIGYSHTAAERWCERFAAAFLLPQRALRAQVDEHFGHGAKVNNINDVRRLAANFNVSLTATAIRLEDLGWGSDLVAQIPKDADLKTRRRGGNADNTRGVVRTRELGEGYFELLLAGESAGILGRQDLLRYLDVNEGQLRSTRIGPLEP